MIEDIRRLSNGQVAVVIDVGAHVGRNALEYAREFPEARIVCLEPSPTSFAQLCANVSAQSRIVPLNLALGARNENATIHLHAGSDQNSLLEDSPSAAAFVGRDFFTPVGMSAVEVNTFDEVCRQQSIEFVDFMKVDTQGYELRVLQGARSCLASKRVRSLLLEVNFVPLYEEQPTFGQLAGLLESFDYGLVGFYNHVYHDNRYLMWCDALFTLRNTTRLSGS